MSALGGEPTLRHFYVEALYPLNPEEVGLKGATSSRQADETLDDGTVLDTVIMREDGGTIVAISGPAVSHTQAVLRASTLAIEVLGDLGSNAAVAGLLRPLRVNVVDTDGYSRFLQVERPNQDAPEPAVPA